MTTKGFRVHTSKIIFPTMDLLCRFWANVFVAICVGVFLSMRYNWFLKMNTFLSCFLKPVINVQNYSLTSVHRYNMPGKKYIKIASVSQAQYAWEKCIHSGGSKYFSFSNSKSYFIYFYTLLNIKERRVKDRRE